ADRLMFALHLVHGTHPEMFQTKEWEFFCGMVVSDMFKRQESMKNLRDSMPSWIDSDRAGPVGSFKVGIREDIKNITLICRFAQRHSRKL
ncbi:Cytoplasmic dynein 2 heavy chain 1, partial [Exaiptasia diaphana]